MIQTTTLSNGIRIVTDTVDFVHKTCLKMVMLVGSRNEPREYNGLAHCLEHSLFLGTNNRTENDIEQLNKTIGNTMNAETSQDELVLIASVLPEDLYKVTEVFADMIQNPIFPADLVDREKAVILSEIAEIEEDDETYADNLMHGAAFKRQPLGMPVSGSPKTVNMITPETLKAFHNMYFRPESLVISVAGRVDHLSFVQQCETLFKDFKNNSPLPEQVKSDYMGGDRRVEYDSEMDVLRIAFNGVSFGSFREYVTAELFGSILEDALYDELRTKHGLLYCVRAENYAYKNEGIFAVSATCESSNVSAVLQRTCACIASITDKMNPEILNMAKKRIKLDMPMNAGTLMDRADSNEMDLRYFGHIISMDEAYQLIDSITVKEVQDLSRKIINTRMAFAGLGNVRKMPTYEQINKWLRSPQPLPEKINTVPNYKICNNQLYQRVKTKE